MSRFENMPTRMGAARMTAMMVDVLCKSFRKRPAAITLDIDDTCDPVYGGQQLSLFNAHYDTHCFLPIHVYDVSSGKPVMVFLREGNTPSRKEVALVLRAFGAD
ncbi:transposase [Aestuariivirga sp.]|uniref:transposase n=1 Tax=Aestuariivirga sp. TaxID=2650926 RepID=UPI0037836DC3